MDIGGGFLAAGDVEVAPARRAGADEDRIPVFSASSAFRLSIALAAAELDAEVEDVAAFLVDAPHSGRRKRGIWVRIMPPAFGS